MFMIIKVIFMMMTMMMMTRFFSLGRRQRMSTLRQLHGLSGKLYVLFLLYALFLPCVFYMMCFFFG